MAEITIAMIAAVGANGVIGSDGALPWRLPTDFRFYKTTTMGHPLIMGRKTFQSIGRPLPGRVSIVVTRDRDYRAEGVEVAYSLAEGLESGRRHAAAMGVDEVFINGGAEIYAQALPLADRLYITHVEASPDGDARFPAFDAFAWTVSAVDGYDPGERDSHRFTIRRYDRPRRPGFD